MVAKDLVWLAPGPNQTGVKVAEPLALLGWAIARLIKSDMRDTEDGG